MKSKGFTIIELLVTIAIIGIVATSASIGINHFIKYKEEKAMEQFKNELESNACLLVDLTKYNTEIITIDHKSLLECRGQNLCLISTDTLYKEGLIKENLYNPKNNEKVIEHGYIIKVTWTDGLKECQLQYE